MRKRLPFVVEALKKEVGKANQQVLESYRKNMVALANEHDKSEYATDDQMKPLEKKYGADRAAAKGNKSALAAIKSSFEKSKKSIIAVHR